MEKIKYWFIGWLTGKQCMKTLKEGNCLSFCVKNEGHFGRCKTNNGQLFN